MCENCPLDAALSWISLGNLILLAPIGLSSQLKFPFVSVEIKLELYRISAPAGIRHFFQIQQKSGSGKNLTGAG